jgi:hypothetical protein
MQTNAKAVEGVSQKTEQKARHSHPIVGIGASRGKRKMLYDD